MKQRIRIDRLDLDLRGIDPALAEAVLPLLGRALERHFARAQGTVKSATRIDAGRVAGDGNAQALADRLAERIVDCTGAPSTGAPSTGAPSSRTHRTQEE